LLTNIKRQYAQLQRENRIKDEEIEKLKKQSKLTKYNEIAAENQALLEELNKIKTLYNIMLQNNVDQ
jgi:hypothetical protein